MFQNNKFSYLFRPDYKRQAAVVAEREENNQVQITQEENNQSISNNKQPEPKNNIKPKNKEKNKV